MKNENNGGGNQIKYSIWNTRTEENMDVTKEKIIDAMDRSSLESKSTEQQH
ncbi:hypothetical protein [Neobacillus cucumis]|uniref:hypothetical protein n=1 Tax=Neobacillus cucumis TaxID=1740721 RepID=UPI0015E09E7D|nr:hypothetical protein [Neobacillus cucumis]